MNDVTGTPEDAEAAWQAWIEAAENKYVRSAFPTERGGHELRLAFLAGFAARPSVTVDEIMGLLAGHGPRDNYDDDGGYTGYICQCRTKDSGPYDTDYLTHLASVIVAHINRETP